MTVDREGDGGSPPPNVDVIIEILQDINKTFNKNSIKIIL